MVKKYDREFKIEAVRLATEPGNTAAKVERGLNIDKRKPGFAHELRRGSLSLGASPLAIPSQVRFALLSRLAKAKFFNPLAV